MALHLAEGGRGDNIPSKAFSEAWGAPAAITVAAADVKTTSPFHPKTSRHILAMRSSTKNIKVQKNQLLSGKIKILRVLYFLKLSKIHSLGFSNRSKCLFLKVLWYFFVFWPFSPFISLLYRNETIALVSHIENPKFQLFWDI